MLTTYASFECVSHVASGSRCEVNPGGKRGVVCFVGKVKDTAQTGEEEGEGKAEEVEVDLGEDDVVDMPPSLPCGYWVGVKLTNRLVKTTGKRRAVKF